MKPVSFRFFISAGRRLMLGGMVTACVTLSALPSRAQSVAGSVVNRSTWDDSTNFALPGPGYGDGQGQIVVAAWSAASTDLIGPPATSNILAPSAALPFGYNTSYAYLLAPGSNDLLLAAWVDGNGNGQLDLGEPRSLAQPINVSTSVLIGVNLVIVDDLDENELPDWWEAYWFDETGVAADGDEDRDGVTNKREFDLLLNPTRFDTDGDGMDDGWEVDYYFSSLPHLNPLVNDALLDADRDGLLNIQEYNGIDGVPVREQDPIENPGVARLSLADSSDALNPLNVDTDDDGLVDSFEAAWYDPANGLDPNSAGDHSADSDKDGLSNYREMCLLAAFREGGAIDLWSSGQSALPLPDANGRRIFSAPLGLGTTQTTIQSDLSQLRYAGAAWTDPTPGTGYNEVLRDGWDTDGDRLPDGWELDFTLDPKDGRILASLGVFNPNGYFGDPDGDGLLNYEEYLGQDGARDLNESLTIGTSDETNPNLYNWRPLSTRRGTGIMRGEVAPGTWWTFDPTDLAAVDGPPQQSGDWWLPSGDGTIGGALPTDSVGWDAGLDSDDDGTNDFDEIWHEYLSGAIRPLSAVHSMDPFIRRCALITHTNGITIPDPEGFITGQYRPDIHRRQWTIESYVKITTTNVTGWIVSAPGFYGMGDVTWRLWLDHGVPKVSFHPLSATPLCTVAGVVLPTNRWIHLAGVWNSTNNSLSLYMDGVFAQSQRFVVEGMSGYEYATTNTLSIGRSADGSFVNQVYLDEIRIWGVARTPDQLESMRARLLSRTSPDLLAYYRFDDGGRTAEDFTRRAQSSLLGLEALEYGFADHGYALSTNDAFAFVDADFAPVRGVCAFGADDADGDGMDDAWETVHHLDPNDPDDAYRDDDRDELNNLNEYWSQTNPDAEDTDGDGDLDSIEDFDGDGLPNHSEQQAGSRPDIIDTDDDGLTDNEEIVAGTNPVDSTSPSLSRAAGLGGGAMDYWVGPNLLAQRLSTWTLEGWVNVNNLPAADGTIVERVVQNLAGGTNAINYALGVVPGGAGQFKGFVEFVSSTGLRTRLTGNAFPADAWVHLAASYNPASKTLMLYTNGVQDATLTSAAGIPPVNGKGSDTMLRLGRGIGGRIDEVRVWTTVRSPTDILGQFEHTLNAQAYPNLLHYVRFDDGEANASVHSFGAHHQPAGAEDFTHTNDWGTQWYYAFRPVGTAGFVVPGAILPPPALRVSILPESAVLAGARWSINSGADWLTSGTALKDLLPGSYTVVFSDLPGWTKPADIPVVLSNGIETLIVTNYLPNGFLRVILEPAAARATSNAFWRVDGSEWMESGEVINLSVGIHELLFSQVPGWRMNPSNEFVAIPSAVTTTLVRTYEEIVTRLQVFINPPQAVAQGAQWRPTTTSDWQTSGLALRIEPGVYNVEFKSIPNWLAPQAQAVTVPTDYTKVATGQYVNAQVIGAFGQAPGQFYRPHGVAVNQRYLYVSDTLNNRIQRLDLASNTWTLLATTGALAGQVRQPMGLRVDTATNLWIADGMNHRVQRRTAAGTWQSYGGAVVTGIPGEMNTPFDLELGTGGVVFVADHYRSQVQRLNPLGAGVWNIAITNGTQAGYVRTPCGLAAVGSNSLVIADDDFGITPRIQSFRQPGAMTNLIGDATDALGAFNHPWGVVAHTTGLVVVDHVAGIVRQLTAAGWTTLVGPGLLNGPTAIATDDWGNLYIADTENHRIVKLGMTDSDGDGLPDWIETNSGIFIGRYDTGTNPNVADSDGDGRTDGQELFDGTDPANGADFLVAPLTVSGVLAINSGMVLESLDDAPVSVIGAPLPAPGGAPIFLLSWPSQVGAIYRVLRSDGLSDPSFSNVLPGVVATPPTNFVIDAAPPPQGALYRVMEE